jgi:general secretion pathway protein J
MRRRGFTLMEVVVAVAITALMGAVIAMAFSSGFKAKETIEHDVESYRGLRTAMARMTREIGAAFVSDRYDALRYRDQNDRPTNFIGQRDRLLFSSMAHQRLYTDAKESDQMTVEYSVKTSTDKNAHGRTDLMRRENPIIDGPMDRGGTEEVLLENVKQLELSYWDTDKKDWVDDWDTRKIDRKSFLPVRVRIVVVAPDENGKLTRYTTQTRIMLNTEFARY